MSTLIVGSSGKIGRYFVKYLNRKAIFTYNKHIIKKGIKFDILKDDINKIINKKKIQKIIILSGISSPDDCFKYKEMSRNINIISTKKLISKIIKKRLYFIFFSSEFVYDGSRGNYSESYPAKPINIYGKQKFLIEKFINSKTKNCAIFRIGKTYGDELSDQSFVASFFNSLIKGKRVFNIAADQKLSPLYVKDLIKIIKIFLKKKIRGTYNIGGSEKISRYTSINNLINKFNSKNREKIQIYKSLLSNFKFIDNRPLDVTMNISKLKKVINFKMTDISKVGQKIIKDYNLNEKIFN